MLFEITTAEAVQTAEVLPGVTLVFDWTSDTYDMTEGSPTEVTGLEAVKAWLELVVRTRRGRYAIYPADFGTSALDLIGRKLPRGYALAELQRELEESAAYCPTIEDVTGVEYDGRAVVCTVTLDDDTTEVITIEP